MNSRRDLEPGRSQRIDELAGLLGLAAAAPHRDNDPRSLFESSQMYHASSWLLKSDLSPVARRVLTVSYWHEAARESDVITHSVYWKLLRDYGQGADLKAHLKAKPSGQRLAALLSLADLGKLKREEALELRFDEDEEVAEVAALWLRKVARIDATLIKADPPSEEFLDRLVVELKTEVPDSEIRYALDGSEPTATSNLFETGIEIVKDSTLKAAVFREGKRIGPILVERYNHLSVEELANRAFVFGISAQSNNRYRLDPKGLQKGGLVYTDRSYVFTEVPQDVTGLTLLKTANDDAGSRGQPFLSFSVPASVDVFVAHDVRVQQQPEWMRTDAPFGFRPTEFYVSTNDTRFRLFRKTFGGGAIRLGGNTDDGNGGGRSNYFVLIKPRPPERLKRKTVVNNVLPLLDKADAERGRRLFFFAPAAGCIRCHQLDGRGNRFAPDLAGVGAGPRRKPREIVQSILEPSAWIVEGFRTQVIATTSGKVHTGVVLGETGQAVRFVTSDAKQILIPKDEIEERVSRNISAMPANFGEYLRPQDVADLAAFLLTQKRPPTRANRDGSPKE